MKQILTSFLLLFSLTISAQTVDVVGPKKKQQTTASAKPKHQPKPAAPAAKTNPKPLQPKVNPKPTTPKPAAVRVSYDSSSNSIVFGNNRYKMVYVSGGSFNMGATSEQGSDAESDEKPTHRVTLSDYYIGQTEVTYALWEAVMESTPFGTRRGDNFPVRNVSWYVCQTFIEKLNSMTGRRFRLPTEAEWEFAARGGNNSQGYKYSGSNFLDDVAWYTNNRTSITHAVATKQANELGIYDMSGNVWEWCTDWYDSNYYKNISNNNPTGSDNGSFRVLRGGSISCFANDCRVSNRYGIDPRDTSADIGLRLVLLPSIDADRER